MNRFPGCFSRIYCYLMFHRFQQNIFHHDIHLKVRLVEPSFYGIGCEIVCLKIYIPVHIYARVMKEWFNWIQSCWSFSLPWKFWRILPEQIERCFISLPLQYQQQFWLFVGPRQQITYSVAAIY